MKIFGRKEVNVAAHNYKAARHFLEIAESTEEGRFFTTKAALIFAAFTHEAFLNTLGSKLIPFWSDLDRLSVGRKLSVISKQISYEPDLSKRPYQTLGTLFTFRNQLAHGRDEVVPANGVSVPDPPADGFYNPLNAVVAAWEAYCTLENGRRAIADVRDVACDLCSHAGLDRFSGYPFGNLASGEFTYDRSGA